MFREFWSLKAEGRLTIRQVECVCHWIASHLEDAFLSNRPFIAEAIEILCEVATLEDQRLRKLGQRTIFVSIAERLSDSFEPTYVSIHDQIFAKIIDFCRRRPTGEALDRMLRRFKIHSEQDLLIRKNRAPSSGLVAFAQRNALRKIIVVSRVTLGADVAVTSVIMRSLATAFPNAELVLIGPEGIRQLYRDCRQFRTSHVGYDRHGSLLDRLQNWLDVVRVIDAERCGVSRNEYIIIDPDSRLTQLGLLPLTEDDDRYFFFESRSYGKAGKKQLGRLAAEWCRETFAAGLDNYPFIRLSTEDEGLGKRCCRWLRNRSAKGVIALNFGVGENKRKRLSLDFETELVLETLSQGYRVILDKGLGEEIDRANRIVGQLRTAGKGVLEFTHSNLSFLSFQNAPPATEVLTWEGRVGVFAGLVAAADLYVGYDSAFQHIAAALGVPVIDMFLRFEHDTFIERWTPYSKAPVKVIRVTAAGSDPFPNINLIISEVLSSFGGLTDKFTMADPKPGMF